MATSMLTYYVKTDSETGYFQAVPQTDAAEGLTQIFILPESRDFLLKNWSHYYLDSDGVTKTDDHRFMDIGTDHLIHLIYQQQAELIRSNGELSTAQNDLTAAKEDVAKVTAENATLKANDSLHDSAIMELSDLLFSQLASSEPSASEVTSTVADSSTSAVTPSQN